MVGVLAVALLLISTYENELLLWLTARWQQGLATVGLRQQADALQQGVNGGITHRFLPAVATYAGLYLGLCLLVLRLLLPVATHWHLTLRLYASALAVYIALVLLAKLIGNSTWLYLLSRQVLDFVVSPLPVVGLYLLLRSGFGPGPSPPPA